jgi:hypothetical protein
MNIHVENEGEETARNAAANTVKADARCDLLTAVLAAMKPSMSLPGGPQYPASREIEPASDKRSPVSHRRRSSRPRARLCKSIAAHAPRRLDRSALLVDDGLCLVSHHEHVGPTKLDLIRWQ